MKIFTALTIAGSDSSGGQRDVASNGREKFADNRDSVAAPERTVHCALTIAGSDSSGGQRDVASNGREKFSADRDSVAAPERTVHCALTIAGSDSSGGAGIQADLKTFLANGVYGMSAITALTAQNTCGVRSVLESTPEFLSDQLDAIFEDIAPDAVKIGMVSSARLIEVIAQRLTHFGARNIVVDPVMVATSGARLIDADAVQTLQTKLFPLATVITPNLPELEVIAREKISSPREVELAAQKIFDAYGCAVLAKGGHGLNDANDYLCDGAGTWFYGRRVDTANIHGTGCTLSSAIAANLAKGHDLKNSVGRAKNYLTGALMSGLDLGKGSGPLDHGFNLRGTDFSD